MCFFCGYANLSRENYSEEVKSMEETVKQEQATEETQNEERFFTQAEVNQIVAERLRKDRAKTADDFAKAKEAVAEEKERSRKLQEEIDSLKHKDEIRIMREKIATETGVPVALLNEETEEACRVQAERIKEFATPAAYPSVMDGGEVVNVGKPTTRQQFAEWANKAFN